MAFSCCQLLQEAQDFLKAWVQDDVHLPPLASISSEEHSQRSTTSASASALGGQGSRPGAGREQVIPFNSIPGSASAVGTNSSGHFVVNIVSQQQLQSNRTSGMMLLLTLQAHGLQLQRQLTTKRRVLAAMQTAQDQANAGKLAALSSLTIAQQEATSLRTRVAELQSQCEQLQASMLQPGEAITDKGSDVASLRQRITLSEKAQAEASSRAGQLQQEVVQLTQKLQDSQAQLQLTPESREAILQRKLETAERQQAAAARNVEVFRLRSQSIGVQMEQAQQAAERMMGEMQEKLRTAERQRAAADKQAEDFASKLDSIGQQMVAAEQAAASKEQDLRQLQSSQDALRAAEASTLQELTSQGATKDKRVQELRQQIISTKTESQQAVEASQSQLSEVTLEAEMLQPRLSALSQQLQEAGQNQRDLEAIKDKEMERLEKLAQEHRESR